MTRPFAIAAGHDALALGLAFLGGLGFDLMHVPGGWITGAMLAVAAAAGFRVPVSVSGFTRNAAMLLSGVSIGAAVTPTMVARITTWPVSIALMIVAVAVIIEVSRRWLERIPGWNRPTSFFASVPGALSYVMLVAPTFEDVDLPRVAVVQIARNLLLAAALPFVAAASGSPLAPAAIATGHGPGTVLVIALAGLAGGALLEAIGVAAGLLVGAMAISAILHGSGLTPGEMPMPARIAAQILTGAWTGARLGGLDWALLRRSLVPALGGLGLTTLTAAAFGSLASLLTGVPFAVTLLAFAPGALDVMTVLAYALGLDPLFVGAHHLARFLFISATLPVIGRLALRAGGRR